MPEEGGKKKAEEAAVAPEAKRPRQEGMPNITPNVEFDTLAREWRCKWSPDDDKASLAACQDALTAIIAEVKAIKGVKGVQRVVCGGCNDFKVLALPHSG
ncbi:hypothetical protein T484DRAFT_1792246 [Baffinella frigidus]|nr:hypothetical protein T484DRAFT_1792246 [Cryptophyta sp. CCMP2293]